MSGALEGLKVVELGNAVSAPFCSTMMADFGADVLKVETPFGGDMLREMGNFKGLWFAVENRNKKCVTLNLKSDEGKEIMHKLLKDADIFIENFRPGALSRLGFGWNELHALYPRLIMISIITGVSVVLVFVCVLKGQGGLLNQALSAITGKKVLISWLGDPRFSHIGATIIYIWMNLGYAMLINLANLQAIPAELYEAAQIDSANRWQCMRYITIPSMKPCFSFLLITTMISGLSRFTDLYVIGGNSTAGQPNNTLVCGMRRRNAE